MCDWTYAIEEDHIRFYLNGTIFQSLSFSFYENRANRNIRHEIEMSSHDDYCGRYCMCWIAARDELIERGLIPDSPWDDRTQ